MDNFEKALRVIPDTGLDGAATMIWWMDIDRRNLATGFHNQRIALENALTLAKITDDQLDRYEDCDSEELAQPPHKGMLGQPPGLGRAKSGKKVVEKKVELGKFESVIDIMNVWQSDAKLIEIVHSLVLAD
ncbi:hypothetical protein H4Q26_002638 [Puccinia striiformis f. sp. tritici PST-130]|nr:hypothetical protein H4Q26_002638 [Puccinia striiformis f. sp. tritici PST-130]